MIRNFSFWSRFMLLMLNYMVHALHLLQLTMFWLIPRDDGAPPLGWGVDDVIETRYSPTCYHTKFCPCFFLLKGYIYILNKLELLEYRKNSGLMSFLTLPVAQIFQRVSKPRSPWVQPSCGCWYTSINIRTHNEGTANTQCSGISESHK